MESLGYLWGLAGAGAGSGLLACADGGCNVTLGWSIRDCTCFLAEMRFIGK